MANNNSIGVSLWPVFTVILAGLVGATATIAALVTDIDVAMPVNSLALAVGGAALSLIVIRSDNARKARHTDS